MTNVPHLHSEDTPEFEKVLDETLRAAPVAEALRHAAPGLTAEQLRTRALRDAAAIAENAAHEYAFFNALREDVRRDAAARATPAPDPADPAPLPSEPLDGAGIAPVAAVLLPILAGIAAVIFLLLGYLLHAADHTLAIGSALITAGWVALGVAAVAMVGGIVGILLTAMRDGAEPPDGQSPERYAELAAAREAWRWALRERGIRPYLDEQLAAHAASIEDGVEDTAQDAVGPHGGAAAGAALATEPPRSGVSLIRERSRLGYTSPRFGSPGVEGITDEEGDDPADSGGEPHFSSPGYGSPAFSSPDFTGPDEPPDDPDGPGGPPQPAGRAGSGPGRTGTGGSRPAGPGRGSGTEPPSLIRPRRPRPSPPPLPPEEN